MHQHHADCDFKFHLSDHEKFGKIATRWSTLRQNGAMSSRKIPGVTSYRQALHVAAACMVTWMTALQAHNPDVIMSLVMLPEEIKAKHRGVLHRQQQRKRKAFEQPMSRHWYADSTSWIRATTVDASTLAQEQQARPHPKHAFHMHLATFGQHLECVLGTSGIRLQFLVAHVSLYWFKSS